MHTRRSLQPTDGATPPFVGDAGIPCADAAETADVCRPRVRARLLAIGPALATGADDVLALAAARLRTRFLRLDSPTEASRYLADNRVSCVVLEQPASDETPLTAIAELKAVVSEDVPVIILSERADSRLAVAAVQAGAQDYVPRNEVNAVSLERTIRHAIERKRGEAKLTHLALHNHLTVLPNRSHFTTCLQEEARRRPAGLGVVAVLFVDVDGFKRINDNLGHAAGDHALREAASRIRAAVRKNDTVARFGGDEFTVLCTDVSDQDVAADLADRVSQVLQRPFLIDGAEVVLKASVGVAFAAGPTSGTELLRDADHAMYEGKRRGGGRVHFHAGGENGKRNEIAIEAALRHAIPGELVAHYQPKVQLRDGAPVGAEALVRWRHPEKGLVSPGVFIPVAERSGLIVPIGRWMLHEACREAMRCRDAGGEPLPISVNVAARQVVDRSLVDHVAGALESSGLPPEYLEIELTETSLIEGIQDDLDVLGGLKELGVSLALDDFGTGYSSLSYLKRFPIDTIKIDRVFVSEIPESREDVAIVSAVISFARALGLTVVAEGVETPAQIGALLDLGCEYAQGFHFHRPIEPEQLRSLVGGVSS